MSNALPGLLSNNEPNLAKIRKIMDQKHAPDPKSSFFKRPQRHKKSSRVHHSRQMLISDHQNNKFNILDIGVRGTKMQEESSIQNHKHYGMSRNQPFLSSLPNTNSPMKNHITVDSYQIIPSNTQKHTQFDYYPTKNDKMEIKMFDEATEHDGFINSFHRLNSNSQKLLELRDNGEIVIKEQREFDEGRFNERDVEWAFDGRDRSKDNVGRPKIDHFIRQLQFQQTRSRQKNVIVPYHKISSSTSGWKTAAGRKNANRSPSFSKNKKIVEFKPLQYGQQLIDLEIAGRGEIKSPTFRGTGSYSPHKPRFQLQEEEWKNRSKSPKLENTSKSTTPSKLKPLVINNQSIPIMQKTIQPLKKWKVNRKQILEKLKKEKDGLNKQKVKLKNINHINNKIKMNKISLTESEFQKLLRFTERSPFGGKHCKRTSSVNKPFSGVSASQFIYVQSAINKSEGKFAIPCDNFRSVKNEESLFNNVVKFQLRELNNRIQDSNQYLDINLDCKRIIHQPSPDIQKPEAESPQIRREPKKSKSIENINKATKKHKDSSICYYYQTPVPPTQPNPVTTTDLAAPERAKTPQLVSTKKNMPNRFGRSCSQSQDRLYHTVGNFNQNKEPLFTEILEGKQINVNQSKEDLTKNDEIIQMSQLPTSKKEQLSIEAELEKLAHVPQASEENKKTMVDEYLDSMEQYSWRNAYCKSSHRKSRRGKSCMQNMKSEIMKEHYESRKVPVLDLEGDKIIGRTVSSLFNKEKKKICPFISQSFTQIPQYTLLSPRKEVASARVNKTFSTDFHSLQAYSARVEGTNYNSDNFKSANKLDLFNQERSFTHQGKRYKLFELELMKQKKIQEEFSQIKNLDKGLDSTADKSALNQNQFGSLSHEQDKNEEGSSKRKLGKELSKNVQTKIPFTYADHEQIKQIQSPAFISEKHSAIFTEQKSSIMSAEYGEKIKQEVVSPIKNIQIHQKPETINHYEKRTVMLKPSHNQYNLRENTNNARPKESSPLFQKYHYAIPSIKKPKQQEPKIKQRASNIYVYATPLQNKALAFHKDDSSISLDDSSIQCVEENEDDDEDFYPDDFQNYEAMAPTLTMQQAKSDFTPSEIPSEFHNLIRTKSQSKKNTITKDSSIDDDQKHRRSKKSVTSLNRKTKITRVISNTPQVKKQYPNIHKRMTCAPEFFQNQEAVQSIAKQTSSIKSNKSSHRKTYTSNAAIDRMLRTSTRIIQEKLNQKEREKNEKIEKKEKILREKIDRRSIIYRTGSIVPGLMANESQLLELLKSQNTLSEEELTVIQENKKMQALLQVNGETLSKNKKITQI